MQINNPTPEQLSALLLNGNTEVHLLHELIASVEALISVVHKSDMHQDMKQVCGQLEKQFFFYARLLEMCSE